MNGFYAQSVELKPTLDQRTLFVAEIVATESCTKRELREVSIFHLSFFNLSCDVEDAFDDRC